MRVGCFGYSVVCFMVCAVDHAALTAGISDALSRASDPLRPGVPFQVVSAEKKVPVVNSARGLRPDQLHQLS
jgi:hypothetical protein